MIGIQYDLLAKEAVYQGADWEKTFQIIDPVTLSPYNLAGYEITAEARKKYNDVTAAIVFTCAITDEAMGLIKLSLTNAETSAIAKGVYRYDVEAAEPAPSTIKHKPIIPSLVQVVEEYTQI